MEINLTPDEVQDILNLKRDRIETLESQFEHSCRSEDLLREKIEELTNENAALRANKINSLVNCGFSEAKREAYNALKADQVVLVRDLLGAIFRPSEWSNKVQAVKAVRELTWLGLKEAKDLIEEHWKPFHSIAVTFTPYPDSEQPFPAVTVPTSSE